MRSARRRRSAAVFFLSGMMCLSAVFCVDAAAVQARKLVPVGHTIGIKLFSDGVVVIGLAEVETPQGVRAPGVACGLQIGDVIEEANGTEVESTEQFSALLQCGGMVDLSVSRGGEELTLTALPVKGEDGQYRLGAWIRDSMAGIGTVTFYDPETGRFGALGHGVTDGDTGQLMPLGDGAVMRSTVKAVKKGSSGAPGQLRGEFDLKRDMGVLYANTEQGVFGALEACEMTQGEALPVAAPSEVHEGKAMIYCNVSGDSVEAYEIEILRVLGAEGSQNMLLHVTDKELIAKTGGIVQGMSGSPIIQDGKLVGAVTHVLVNDPTRGYGIFIENMLEAAE
ncbi:MAG: SpoIVB peptidase [Oscillospiraceae bacterium]|nr:SpoIVB peptidase [Oscillospiraceae bacterium]